MASETRIEFISDGFKQILESDGVHNLVQDTANDICDKANANNNRGGEGFTTNVIKGGYGGGRWIGFVKASDKEASIAEAEDKALSGAVI